MIDASAYDDEQPVREIPNGPHYRSRELRQVERAQLFRAVEQVEAKGYTLPQATAHEQAKAHQHTKPEQKRWVEATKHLSLADAAKEAGVSKAAMVVWRRNCG